MWATNCREVAESEDGQQTGLSACAVADDHQLPKSKVSEDVRGLEFIRLILPPHHLLIALCHCVLLLGQPRVMLTSRETIIRPMASWAIRAEQTAASSS